MSDHFKAIKTMLRSAEWDQIFQGVELAASIGDDALVEQLLEGTTFQLGGERPYVGRASKHNKIAQVIGRVVPGDHFASKAKTLLWDEMACLHLLARTNHPLRDEITHLHLQARLPGYEFSLNLNGLEGLPKLKALDLNLFLHRCDPVDLSPLTSMDSLRELTIFHRGDNAHGQFTIPPIDQVTELRLRTIDAKLTSAKSLKELRGAHTIAAMPVLPTVTRLESFSFSPDLLKLVPNVEQVECHELRFPDRPVPSLRFIEPDTVKQRSILRAVVSDVGSLSNLADLQMLRLSSPTNEELAISELMACTDLRILDLAGRSTLDELAALDEHPNLRMIRLTESDGIGKADVPKSLRGRVSWAMKPDFDKAAQRPSKAEEKAEKAAAPKLSSDNRKALPKLKKLLRNPDAASIQQGVELAVSMGEAEIFVALTDGVAYVEDVVTYTDPDKLGGRLVPNKIFTGSGARQGWLDLSLALLIAASDLPIRKEVKSLTLGQPYYSSSPILTFPTRGLSGFPNLEELTLHIKWNADVDLSSLSSLKSLKTLRILCAPRGNQSAMLAAPPALQTLHTSGIYLDPTCSWPKLTSLDIVWPSDASANRGEDLKIDGKRFAKLRHVNVRSEATLSKLAKLETIVFDGSVAISDCPELRSITSTRGTITALANVPKLTDVAIEHAAGETFDSVHDIESITRFVVGKARQTARTIVPPSARTDQPLHLIGPIGDLGNLGDLRGLQHLTISMQDEPLSLDTLAGAGDLRVLDIRDCEGITSLDPLKDLTELRMIAAKNSGVKSVPDSLEHVVSRAAKPDVAGAIDRPARKKPTKKKTIPVDEQHRDEWEIVVAELATDSVADAIGGIDRAANIGQDALEFLISKVAMKSDKARARVPFRLGEPWMATPVAGHLLSLLENSTKPAQLLQMAEIVHIAGKTWNGSDVETGDLSGFSGMTKLIVDHCRRAAVGDLHKTSIETLIVKAEQQISIEGAVPPTLTRALFSRSRAPLEQLGNNNLLELYLVGRDDVDLALLAGSSKLTKLHIAPFWKVDRLQSLETLRDLPLTELTIAKGIDLGALSGHPTLKTLNRFEWYGPKGIELPSDLKRIDQLGMAPRENALD